MAREKFAIAVKVKFGSFFSQAYLKKTIIIIAKPERPRIFQQRPLALKKTACVLFFKF